MRTIHDAVVYKLLMGIPPARVMNAAMEAGLSEHEASLAVAQVLADPIADTGKTIGARLRAREWMNAVMASLARDSGRPLIVERRSAIQRDEFLRDYYYANRPLVVPGIAREWPAVTLWTEDYLRAQCGDVTVTTMRHRTGASPGEQYDGDTLRTPVRLGEFLERVFRGAPSNDWYLVGKNEFFARPETVTLLTELASLPSVDARFAGDYVGLWLGPAGTLTPWHCDPCNGFLVQVVGRKRVRMYAPCFAAFMEQAGMWYAGTDDPKGAGGEAWHAHPLESEVVLDPGDGLFIPVGWWHEVLADTPSITVTSDQFGVSNSYWP